MIEFVRQILAGQFEAALAMLKQCVAACPAEHYEGKIANDSFRYVAYHTLFFCDYYLARTEEAFELRDLHTRGGDERGAEASPGLSQEETLAYAEICHEKLQTTLAGETLETLQGPSGFARRKISRAELYIYNLRHIQHHAGQLSAYLRRMDAKLSDPKELRWIGGGWK